MSDVVVVVAVTIGLEAVELQENVRKAIYAGHDEGVLIETIKGIIQASPLAWLSKEMQPVMTARYFNKSPSFLHKAVPETVKFMTKQATFLTPGAALFFASALYYVRAGEESGVAEDAMLGRVLLDPGSYDDGDGETDAPPPRPIPDFFKIDFYGFSRGI